MTNILNKRWRKAVFLLIVVFTLQAGMSDRASGQVTPPQTSSEAEVEEAKKLILEVVELSNRGAYDEALPKAMRALEIRERVLDPEHPSVAASLSTAGYILFRKNNYVKAREYFKRALTIQEKLGLKGEDAAALLNSVGLLDYAEGDRVNAERNFRQALAVQEKTPEALETPLTAIIRTNIASVLSERGDYEGAEKLFRDILTTQEKKWGAQSVELLLTLNNIATMNVQLGRAGEAMRHLNRGLEIVNTLQQDPPAALPVISNLLFLTLQAGDYDKSESLARRALALLEKNAGGDAFYIVLGYNSVGQFYKAKGDFEKAELYTRRALSTLENASLMGHSYASEVLTNLGIIYAEQDEYDQAEGLFQRARTMRQSVYGTAHPHYATSLAHLADLQRRKGRFVEAEAMFKDALAIYRQTVGERHPYSAAVMNNLGLLYVSRGDLKRAEEQLRQALEIREQVLPPGQSDIAISLMNLARCYALTNRLEQEEPLLQRALKLFERSHGPESHLVARTLNDLGLLHYKNGELPKAEALFKRAIAINEKRFGPDHLEITPSLNNLALLYQSRNDLNRAEPLYQRALGIYEKSRILKHPALANLLENLSLLYTTKGDIARAGSSASRAAEIEEYNLDLMLGAGSEIQNRTKWLELQRLTWTDISLHTIHAPNNQLAARLALTTVLRRKGRVLDAMTGSLQALRASTNPADKELLDKLSAARSQLAAMISESQYRFDDGVFNPAQMARLEEEYQRLEAMVNARSAESARRPLPVTIENIQKLIPEDAALIEFVSYRPFNARTHKSEQTLPARRYVAYVLRRHGQVAWADLGEASKIEGDIWNLRPALRDYRRTDVKVLARKVERDVMRPIRHLLGKTRWLLISPDVMLHLIPFEALVDAQGRYLTERYLFTYLSSARDLPRLQSTTPSEQPPVIVANPDFDMGVGEVKNTPPSVAGESPLSTRPSRTRFTPLVGTEDEAHEIAKLLPGSRLLTGSAATTTALKQLHSPSILHIAAHGYFPPGSANLELTKIGGEEVFKPSIATLFLDFYRTREGLQHISSLSQSGIALAGANNENQQGEDGLLTAFEVSGLDLRGTKLAVLSACETGIGDVEISNGVYGLRRSLVLAGAESQVMSLWKVNDEVTRDMMLTFYTRLRADDGRSKALRQARLSMFGKKNYRHPYFWASFIQSGDWRKIEAMSK